MVKKKIVTICMSDEVKALGKEKAEKRQVSFSQFIEDCIKRAR